LGKPKARTHIKYVHPALVDEKALEQALDNHQALAENQNSRVDQCARAPMEDEEE
jgi:hypothetical protein